MSSFEVEVLLWMSDRRLAICPIQSSSLHHLHINTLIDFCCWGKPDENLLCQQMTLLPCLLYGILESSTFLDVFPHNISFSYLQRYPTSVHLFLYFSISINSIYQICYCVVPSAKWLLYISNIVDIIKFYILWFRIQNSCNAI